MALVDPPVREPVVDARGYITPRWLAWLKELVRVLNGGA